MNFRLKKKTDEGPSKNTESPLLAQTELQQLIVKNEPQGPNTTDSSREDLAKKKAESLSLAIEYTKLSLAIENQNAMLDTLEDGNQSLKNKNDNDTSGKGEGSNNSH
ncbi:hypothetical protein RFI_36156 [Reticulomyxa filosa]|uniref:Uncharacterized protein n=1 Tax=Reticulomyxa filosa TaxID=46433 RepID=X6LIU3_RETFI|nr:hypothetical protein RFI_36156 [Reticulomyxa filosa]|eukprot:ETO01281.1 hypothetical protein RFI_36156 [Reticulomyxa filosa]